MSERTFGRSSGFVGRYALGIAWRAFRTARIRPMQTKKEMNSCAHHGQRRSGEGRRARQDRTRSSQEGSIDGKEGRRAYDGSVGSDEDDDVPFTLATRRPRLGDEPPGRSADGSGGEDYGKHIRFTTSEYTEPRGHQLLPCDSERVSRKEDGKTEGERGGGTNG
jgi:hypothetical protein